MDKEEVLRKISKIKWWHSIELMPGVFTPGYVSYSPKEWFDNIYKIPKNLSGLSALDIGTWDGAFAFELERRGADTTALDRQNPDCSGFNTAKEILHSNVKYIQAEVYDLDKVLNTKFDIVNFLGVYYHLKNPILAFELISKILKDDGLLLIEGECLFGWAPTPREAVAEESSSSTMPSYRKLFSTIKACYRKLIAIKCFRFVKIGAFVFRKCQHELFISKYSRCIKTLANSDVPITLFYSGKYKKDASNWFIPNVACLREWLLTAGLELVSHKGTKDFIYNQRIYGVVKKNTKSTILSESYLEGKGSYFNN